MSDQDQNTAENAVEMAWNTVRAEARALTAQRLAETGGLSELLAAVEEYGDRRVAQAALVQAPAVGAGRPNNPQDKPPAWTGAVAFIQHVQNAAGATGHWSDEFLAWYKPDEWFGEHRAAAVFVGQKVAALAAQQAEREPYGWLFGNSFWEATNRRITDEIKRLGKPLYDAPQTEREPLTADVECITDESGTDYSVSVRGPGLRNPLYSDVWTKKKQAELLAKWLNMEVLPAAASKREPLSKAAQDVLEERQRQIEREGYTRQLDADMHDSNDLARAAAFYAMAEVGHEYGRVAWPWDEEGCKVKDRYRNFIRAAALLIAAADVERARSTASHVPVQANGNAHGISNGGEQ